MSCISYTTCRSSVSTTLRLSLFALAKAKSIPNVCSGFVVGSGDSDPFSGVLPFVVQTGMALVLADLVATRLPAAGSVPEWRQVNIQILSCHLDH